YFSIYFYLSCLVSHQLLLVFRLSCYLLLAFQRSLHLLLTFRHSLRRCLGLLALQRSHLTTLYLDENQFIRDVPTQPLLFLPPSLLLLLLIIPLPQQLSSRHSSSASSHCPLPQCQTSLI